MRRKLTTIELVTLKSVYTSLSVLHVFFVLLWIYLISKLNAFHCISVFKELLEFWVLSW